MLTLYKNTIVKKEFYNGILSFVVANTARRVPTVTCFIFGDIFYNPHKALQNRGVLQKKVSFSGSLCPYTDS